MKSSLDLLVFGGRVVDAPTGTVAIRDVGIQRERIVSVAPEPISAASVQCFDATGCDVLPGVIDLHTHLSSEFGGRVARAMLVRAGVTTALDLAGPVDDVLDQTRSFGAGITIGALQRLKPGENLASNDPSRMELRHAIAAAREGGALGVKILGGHFPHTPDATVAAVQEARVQGVWIAVHCGTTTTPGDFRGFVECLELIAGLPAHVAHVNAYCRGTTARRALEAGGFPATSAGLRAALLAGYALAHQIRDGQVQLTAGPEAVHHWESNGTRVGVSFQVNDAMAAILLAGSRGAGEGDSVSALASDGGGIPRNDTLRLGYMLVRMGVMDLQDLVRKASLAPARYMGLSSKGQLIPGADADIVIVRPEDGTVVATIASGRFVYRDGSVIGGKAHWLALNEGAREARKTALDVQVIDPVGQGLYGLLSQGLSERLNRVTPSTRPSSGRAREATAENSMASVVGDLHRPCSERRPRRPVTGFAEAFTAWPKAFAKVTGEMDPLLAFFDYPAEHHIHLRTRNPIESTFSTVRLRMRVTKGAGSRAAVGLQARRRRPGPLAPDQRPAPRATRPSRREVHRRSAKGKERAAAPRRTRHHRGARLTPAHPQLLTISRGRRGAEDPQMGVPMQSSSPADRTLNWSAIALGHDSP